MDSAKTYRNQLKFGLLVALCALGILFGPRVDVNQGAAEMYNPAVSDHEDGFGNG